MSIWDKLKVISAVLASVLVPLILGVVGHRYTQALKEREVQSRFVELAVDILSEPPADEKRNLRIWATRVINEYSGVALDSATARELVETFQLPTAATARDYTTASRREREGFELLLAGRYDSAIAAFAAAEAAYPTYHQVYEIGRLLRRNRNELADPATRGRIIRQIVDEYAWGAPEDLLSQLRAQVAE